jgi:hypothetical protein
LCGNLYGPEENAWQKFLFAFGTGGSVFGKQVSKEKTEQKRKE